MNSQLNCIHVNPSSPAIATVIWLHGLGADGNDFVPMIPELQIPSDLPVRFIFPNAPLIPVTINNGYVMRAWYDIVSMNIEQRADKQGIDNSVLQIIDLIKIEESLGIPSEKIILAGFSQGAVIALSTSLNFNKKLGGVLALSGYVPFASDTLNNAPSTAKETPVFMAHGMEDTVIPYAVGLAGFNLLKKQGLPISWHSYEMGHSVCGEEVLDISRWLQTTLRA